MKLFIELTLFLFLLLSFKTLKAEDYVRKIYIIKEDVSPDSVFSASILNSLHTLTKDYIIRQELRFKEDEVLNYFNIYETERNLRATGLFTSVEVDVDTVGSNYVDIYIYTRDKFSTQPSILFGSEGGAQSLGFMLSESNFLGHNWQIDLEYLNRTENNIGNQGRVLVNKSRLFQHNFDLFAELSANRFKTNQEVKLSKPFRNFLDKNQWELHFTNNYGQDFIYDRAGQFGKQNHFTLLNTRQLEFNSYYHLAWANKDRVFAGLNFNYNDIERGNPNLRRAFDNTASILAHFSSVSQEFVKTTRMNDYKDEDLIVGGYGSAILGRTFKTDSTGDEVWYLGGRAERSFLTDKFYIYLGVEGGSGFVYSKAKYTYEEFNGLFNYLINDRSSLVLRVKQQTAWQWEKSRQLILDPMSGLRGYSVNQFTGDNRFISNLEYRIFPGWELWLFKISGALFWDNGTVWTQNSGFKNARFHNSAGLGLRLHNGISVGDGSILRVDFAWNFDENRFGGIIFTSEQLFSAFENHKFRLPSIFGLEFNEQ